MTADACRTLVLELLCTALYTSLISSLIFCLYDSPFHYRTDNTMDCCSTVIVVAVAMSACLFLDVAITHGRGTLLSDSHLRQILRPQQAWCRHLSIASKTSTSMQRRWEVTAESTPCGAARAFRKKMSNNG